jgi:hypothetical protein
VFAADLADRHEGHAEATANPEQYLKPDDKRRPFVNPHYPSLEFHYAIPPFADRLSFARTSATAQAADLTVQRAGGPP